MGTATNERQTMDAKLLQKFLAKTGQICSVSWERDCKTRQGSPKVSKTVSAVVRAGLSYDSQAVVKEKRETGELPAKNAGLTWGEWLIFPYVIAHKGNHYFRFYPFPGGKVETAWQLDGRPADFEQVAPYLLASEKQEKNGDCFVVKAESILSLN